MNYQEHLHKKFKETVQGLEKILTGKNVQMSTDRFADVYLLCSSKPIVTDDILVMLSHHFGCDLTRYQHKETFQETIEANKFWLEIV